MIKSSVARRQSNRCRVFYSALRTNNFFEIYIYIIYPTVSRDNRRVSEYSRRRGKVSPF